MGYSPGFLAKNGEFSTLANSPEIDTKQSRKELEIILEGFRRRLREFGAICQDLPKSTMFKTMGYSPGFLAKNGEFSTLANSPEIDTKRRARS